VIGYLTFNPALVQACSPQPVRRTRREILAHHRFIRMAPRLSDYFREGEILASKGDLDVPVSGLVLDSRRVVPGSVFFALPGRRADGAQFIDEAVSRGAAAVVASRLPVAAPAKVAFVRVADPRATLARVARPF
jgi:UDP-N-acetylmuramoyl-L-alanyl-D-glutamate--2,6-diaminopimelate ligase